MSFVPATEVIRQLAATLSLFNSNEIPQSIQIQAYLVLNPGSGHSMNRFIVPLCIYRYWSDVHTTIADIDTRSREKAWLVKNLSARGEVSSSLISLLTDSRLFVSSEVLQCTSL